MAATNHEVLLADASAGMESSTLDPICPYLLADEGGWRATRAMPEHRCMARQPAEPVPLSDQRRLCLTTSHVTCPIFETAMAERQAAMAAAGLRAERVASRRHVALTRPTPTALERPSAVPGSMAFMGGTRRLAEVGLIGLMLLAAIVLFAARFDGLGLSGAAATATPSGAIASDTPTPTASIAVSPTPTLSPSPTPAPTQPPTATPAPTPTSSPTSAAQLTYRVSAGDTLSSIAARFQTTVTAIEQANGITDPRALRVGQVLTIP